MRLNMTAAESAAIHRIEELLTEAGWSDGWALTDEEVKETNEFPLFYRNSTPILTFYALDGNVKTVWCPVIIPVTSTGVNYHEVARCSEDVLMEALTKVANIESAEAAREAAEFQRNNSENIRIANEATRQSNESERIANWGALQPQMEQIIADTAAAEAAAKTINDIYSQMSMTLCYDDEGYPCYAEEE